MQMHHSGVDIFIISRLNTKAPNIKQQLSQIDHSRSTIKTCGACIGPIAFDVMMLYLSQDDKLSSCGLWMFQISTMANFKQNFLDFWSFFTRPRDNDEAGPHVVQAHDFLTFLTTILPLSWFLGKYHSEMKCFFVH